MNAYDAAPNQLLIMGQQGSHLQHLKVHTRLVLIHGMFGKRKHPLLLSTSLKPRQVYSQKDRDCHEVLITMILQVM